MAMGECIKNGIRTKGILIGLGEKFNQVYSVGKPWVQSSARQKACIAPIMLASAQASFESVWHSII